MFWKKYFLLDTNGPACLLFCCELCFSIKIYTKSFCFSHFIFLFSLFWVFEGTTKRKELHGTTFIHALSGTWGEKDEAIFQVYKFDFCCNIPWELYSGFVLLIETKLDDDVGNIELELYLVSKMVKSSVSFCGQLRLEPEQVQALA